MELDKKDVIIALLELRISLLECLVENRYDPDVIETADSIIAWFDKYIAEKESL
jgi:hypothetical protein